MKGRRKRFEKTEIKLKREESSGRIKMESNVEKRKDEDEDASGDDEETSKKDDPKKEPSSWLISRSRLSRST